MLILAPVLLAHVQDDAGEKRMSENVFKARLIDYFYQGDMIGADYQEKGVR